MRLNHLFLLCKNFFQLHSFNDAYSLYVILLAKQLLTNKLNKYSLHVLFKYITVFKVFVCYFMCIKAYVNNIHKL